MKRRKGEPTKPHSKKRSVGAISLLQRRIINMVLETGSRKALIKATDLDRSGPTVNIALLKMAARELPLLYFDPRDDDCWWVSLTDEGVSRAKPEHQAMVLLASEPKRFDREFWQPKPGAKTMVKSWGGISYTNTNLPYSLTTSTVSASTQAYVITNALSVVQSLPKSR